MGGSSIWLGCTGPALPFQGPPPGGGTSQLIYMYSQSYAMGNLEMPISQNCISEGESSAPRGNPPTAGRTCKLTGNSLHCDPHCDLPLPPVVLVAAAAPAQPLYGPIKVQLKKKNMPLIFRLIINVIELMMILRRSSFSFLGCRSLKEVSRSILRKSVISSRI